MEMNSMTVTFFLLIGAWILLFVLGNLLKLAFIAAFWVVAVVVIGIGALKGYRYVKEKRQEGDKDNGEDGE